MTMFRRILFVLNVLICAVASGQDLSELDKRYGFKDIRLETIPDSVKGAKVVKEFKEKDEFPAKLYSVSHENYTRIGDVKVRGVELKAYKDQIYEISVITEKDVRLMKALESLYGKAEYDLKNETYFWKTDNVILKFRSAGRNQLELLYSSFAVQKLMKEDKRKEVDDIANDF
jgi:hypothetical protein